jgi:hypothetical protein
MYACPTAITTNKKASNSIMMCNIDVEDDAYYSKVINIRSRE